MREERVQPDTAYQVGENGDLSDLVAAAPGSQKGKASSNVTLPSR